MFKLVCGAGNEDEEQVKRLVYVYSLAGCKLFDLSARKEILDAAKEGQRLSGINDVEYCVSIGIKGDKHIKKAKVDDLVCTKCGNCLNICPNNAIKAFVINEKKCIGCSLCFENCPARAVIMTEKDVDYNEVLPYMVNNGVDILELHIMGHDKEDLQKKWQVINECKPKLASICIDRENFGNKEVLERIRDMIKDREPYTTIVQADGIPMSGANDDYKTTLQAVAMAEIIQNSKLPVLLMISGGTNSKTAELARLCDINCWGIAVGSWARKIVNEYITQDDFWQNKSIQQKAVSTARNLVESCA